MLVLIISFGWGILKSFFNFHRRKFAARATQYTIETFVFIISFFAKHLLSLFAKLFKIGFEKFKKKKMKHVEEQ